MKKIVEYVNERFSELPMSEEAAKLKTALTENMVEKYERLIKSGKNEDEAFGIVVYDFGSMSEIKKELGIENVYADNNEKKYNVQDKLLIEEFQKKVKKGFYTGICFCMLGVILFVLFVFTGGLYNLHENFYFRNAFEFCAIASFFIFELIGLILLIIFSIKTVRIKNKICIVKTGKLY